MEEEDDDEYNPKSKKAKSKSKEKDVPSAAGEQARALHTLDENHNRLMFGALNSSITGSIQGVGGPEPSSSMMDGGFGFDDVFAFPADAGGADIGDELARELGEGWGASAVVPAGPCVQLSFRFFVQSRLLVLPCSVNSDSKILYQTKT